MPVNVCRMLYSNVLKITISQLGEECCYHDCKLWVVVTGQAEFLNRRRPAACGSLY